MNTNDVKAIMKAAKAGDTARVKELLDADPGLVAAREADESTPLHCAAWKGRRDVVALLLLQHGADPDARGVNGRTPLDETGFHNATAAARVLRQHGARI